MRKVLLPKVLAIVFACLISSCSRFIVPPMAGSNNISYLPRPFIRDSSISRTYITGEYSASASDDTYTVVKSGILNISRAYANKNLNASIGAFGFFGGMHYKDTYDNKIDEYRKSFSGWGLRSTIGFHIVSNDKRINFRIINWENAYSQEYGAYSKFRNSLIEGNIQINDYSDFYVSKIKNIYTTGLSSEIILNEFLDNKDLSVGYRIFIGYSPKVTNSFYDITNRSYYTDPSNAKFNIIISHFYLNYKKLYGTSEIGLGDNTSSLKLGFGYTL